MVSLPTPDLTLAYNVSDWTSGYFGDIGGFIAYFSATAQDEKLRWRDSII